MQLMRHESDLLARVGHHPNLATRRGFFEKSYQCALVLDLVEGGDCQQLLQRQGALPEASVRSMMCELHSAIRHLHLLDVLHRDVKLENVLVDTSVRPPSVTLCDLGHAICCSAVEQPTDRHFFGTPGYAAPEVRERGRWRWPLDGHRMAVNDGVRLPAGGERAGVERGRRRVGDGRRHVRPHE